MDGIKFDGVVGPSVWHRTIDGDKLVAARNRLGMSQKAFAEACGYSQQFQQQIERPGSWEVTTQMAQKIEDVLRRKKEDGQEKNAKAFLDSIRDTQ